MFAAILIKWTLILLLFVALPIALLRFMVHKTIEINNNDRR
jgi:hypothetical protein